MYEFLKILWMSLSRPIMTLGNCSVWFGSLGFLIVTFINPDLSVLFYLEMFSDSGPFSAVSGHKTLDKADSAQNMLR